jgi:RpiR family carbohydrate utilization transcriptional regulator|tara:strand:+ start:3072 stop:3968 length:897 start_codon:yes stop_codon:yes gene_type:complete
MYNDLSVCENKLHKHNIHNNNMILENLVNGETKLSKSEKKIALEVLNNPSKVINQSISSLALQSGVSLPTVNRFCKKLGFSGYPAFKIQIAQETTNTNSMLLDRFNVDKDTPEIVKRVMSDIQSTVVSVGQNLDPSAIDKATNMLATAKSITFFGLGGSGPVALDAQHKFFRFGIPVVAHIDYINQRMIASMMREEDILVLISFTGRTAEIVQTAKVAKKNNVQTIALTSKNSPLAKLSNVVLHIDAPLENNLHIPMTSRLAHLAIIDILSATVQARFGTNIDVSKDEVIRNIEKTRV